MTPELVAAARHIWLGRPDPGDAGVVRAYLTRRYPVGVPAADVTAAFWVLSLSFQEPR